MQSKIIHVNTFTNEYNVEVEWDITSRCNYACSYCKSYDNTQPLLFKKLVEYEEAIDYLITYFVGKRIKIDFLGGEPTLYKDWANLLQLVHDKGHVPKLITNLAVPTKTLIDKLANKTFTECIDVSFHPEFANPASFIEKTKLLHERGFLRTISVLMHPDYWDICKTVCAELYTTGKVSYSRIKNEDTNSTSIASSFIEYTPEQKLLLDTAISANPVTGRYTEVVYENNKEIYPDTQDLFSNNITNFKGMSCFVGRDRLHIKANGDVYPSACLLKYPKSRLGNIYKQDLRIVNRPVICPFNFCGCGPDMRIEKKLVSTTETL